MTGFDQVRPGDRFRLTATKDKRLEVGARGVVERTKTGVDRYSGLPADDADTVEELERKLALWQDRRRRRTCDSRTRPSPGVDTSSRN